MNFFDIFKTKVKIPQTPEEACDGYEDIVLEVVKKIYNAVLDVEGWTGSFYRNQFAISVLENNTIVVKFNTNPNKQNFKMFNISGPPADFIIYQLHLKDLKIEELKQEELAKEFVGFVKISKELCRVCAGIPEIVDYNVLLEKEETLKKQIENNEKTIIGQKTTIETLSSEIEKEKNVLNGLKKQLSEKVEELTSVEKGIQAVESKMFYVLADSIENEERRNELQKTLSDVLKRRADLYSNHQTHYILTPEELRDLKKIKQLIDRYD